MIEVAFVKIIHQYMYMYIGDQNFDLFFASTMKTIRLHIHNTRDECYFQNITGETY